MVPIASEPTEQEVREEISREIHRIYEESYGRGAGSAETLMGDGWAIVILAELELLPNEELLVESGDRDAVTGVRTRYQQAIQAPLRAAVERATGRKVTGFASTTSVDKPRFAVEIFKLD
ncbi:MAG TPA: Na-translocating system protein MpsC family protein [Solirubrobacterales bacterium]